MPAYLVSSRDLKFAVGIASGIRHSQRTSARVHDQGVAGCAILVGHADRQLFKHLPVEFDIPGGAARISELSKDRVRVCGRAQHVPMRPQGQHGTRRELGERGNVQRHAVIEQAASRLEQSSSIASQRKCDARPRSGVRGIGDRIAIEPQPEVDCQPLGRSPLIAGEPGEFILVNGKAGRRSELDSF